MLKRSVSRTIQNRAIVPQLVSSRCYASADCGDSGNKKGVVLGVYDGCNPGEFKMTPTTQRFNDDSGGKLAELIKGSDLKLGKAHVLANISQEFQCVAVAGLGPDTAGFDSHENLDECKEHVRIAAGVGVQALQDRGITTINLESFTNSESAAEGGTLGVWRYEELKNADNRHPTAKIELFQDPDRDGWQRGIIKADAQNIARHLEETPANMMTPSLFATKAIEILCPCGVGVEVRDKMWMERNKMTALLTIAKSSCEVPLFLELGFCTAAYTEPPVVVVGKGVTFDTGGLMLKPCKGMDSRRAEMAGAAVIVGLLKCIASLNLPINVTAFLPLCENMLGGMSVKPGDVLMGLTGKSMRVEDPDNEGRVLATEALTYSKVIHPCLAVHIGSISDGTRKAIGSGATGLWTRSNVLWEEMSKAGAETGDRVWRFPIWKEFFKQCEHRSVDMNNVSPDGEADPCQAAAFIETFAPPKADFCHLDIMGSGLVATGTGMPYLRKGLMTGRPVRTLAQFLYQMVCPHEKGEECGP